MRHSNAPQNAAVDPNRHAGLFTKTQFHSCQWHFTNSCTVPSRGASGNRRGSQIGEETVQSLVQVSPRISAGVHSGYQMVRGDICLRRMHALRSSPGENTASCHRDCWFCPRHITNPLLILFGRGKKMWWKLEQECLYQGRPSLLGSNGSRTKRYQLQWNVLRLWSCQEKISCLKVAAVE